MSLSLLNKSRVKKYILHTIKDMRGEDFPVIRVSSQALEIIEAEIRARITREVGRCPSKGKTFYMPEI